MDEKALVLASEVSELSEVLGRITEGLEVLEKAKKELKKKLKKGIHYDLPFSGAKQNVLLKPGADQLAYLTGIEVVERKDEEIRDKDGNIIGFKTTLRLRSKLLKREVISTRIASRDEVKARNWSLDMLIAMAFKRAWVYGVIQLTGLSDLFIDEEKEELRKEERKATERQINYLKKLLDEKGIPLEKVEEKYGRLEDLSAQKASELIEKVKPRA